MLNKSLFINNLHDFKKIVKGDIKMGELDISKQKHEAILRKKRRVEIWQAVPGVLVIIFCICGYFGLLDSFINTIHRMFFG